MVGRITAPKDVHILILGICGYVTSQGKRDFADVTRGKALKIERLSWIILKQARELGHEKALTQHCRL